MVRNYFFDRRNTKRVCYTLTLFFSLFCSSASSAREFFVDTTDDTIDVNPGDGECADNSTPVSKCSLRAAIMESNAWSDSGPDKVVLLDKTYQLRIPKPSLETEDLGAETGDLDIVGNLIILGKGKNVTNIDGGAHDRIFNIVKRSEVTINALTIRNGFVATVDPDVAYADYGGGIRVDANASLIITDCTITKNQAIRGGGISIGGNSSQGRKAHLSITNCTISDNLSTTMGGGVDSVIFGSATIRDSVITGNTALNGAGGGLAFGYKSVAVIDGTTISGNRSDLGGGIAFIYSGDVLRIANSTVSGNIASTNGGGVYMQSSYGTELLEIANSTITENRAEALGAGGGIHVVSGNIGMSNSILANNVDLRGAASDCTGVIKSYGYNLVGQGSECAVQATTTDIIGIGNNPINPMLSYLADNGGSTPTHALLSNSPAVDAGNPAVPGSSANACEPYDQRDVVRTNIGRCDIGAFELTVTDLWVTLSDATSPSVGSSVSHIVKLGNLGPNISNQVKLSITFPDDSENQSVVSQGWNCASVSNEINCIKFLLDIDSEDELYIEYLPGINADNLITVATVSSSIPDPVLSNNTSQLVVKNPIAEGSDKDDVSGDSETIEIDDNIFNDSENHSKQAVVDIKVDRATIDELPDIDILDNNLTDNQELIHFEIMNNKNQWAELLSSSAISSSEVFNYSFGGILIAGAVNFFLVAMNLFGAFFTSPLITNFDAIHITLLTKKEKKELNKARKAELNIENKNKKIGYFLDGK